TSCLAEIQTERFDLWMIYRLLLSLPETSSPEALREQFPAAFDAAARGCFGTADPAAMPADVPLRGAAMYGLGRVDRGLVMPALLARGEDAAMAEFGRLMSITHDGDRVTRWQNGVGEPFTGNQERLADDYLKEMLAAAL